MEPDDENARYCRKRGRPRLNRSLMGEPPGRCYAPQCKPENEEESVTLLPEEMAALTLIDLQELEQEQAAAVLGVSRKTIWRDIHEAHRKISDAIVNGKSIHMARCTRMVDGRCPKKEGNGCKQTRHRGCHGDQAADEQDIPRAHEKE